MACRCRLPRGGAPGRGRAHRSFLVATPPSAGLVTSRQTFVLRCRNWRFGFQSSRGVAKAKAMPPLRTTIPPLKRYCHANPARPPVRLARQNKCLAQTNKSDTRAKATDKRRSDTGSAAQFRALAKLAKGKTRYWISAAGLLNDHWYVGSPPSLPGMRRGADPVRGAAPPSRRRKNDDHTRRANPGARDNAGKPEARIRVRAPSKQAQGNLSTARRRAHCLSRQAEHTASGDVGVDEVGIPSRG